MSFQEYSPEQAALLPLHVRDALDEKHLVFLISAVVEKHDLRAWEAAYGDEGQRPYHPALLLKVLLYAFALGVRGSRKIEQRIREDLGFRYLAAGAQPDHKTICEFLRRHGRRVNDLFTAALEQLQRAGLGKLGVVALDSTRVKANASRDRLMTETGLRMERARSRRQVRKWQRELLAMDSDENPGGVVAEMERVRQRLAEIPGELEKLRKSGLKKMSRTDADSRFLHSREGFVLGYTAEAAVSEEGLIVAARVTQSANDHASLVPLVAEAEQRCGQRPRKVLADAGFYSNENVEAMEEHGVELYVPDSVLAREMKQGRVVRGAMRISHAGLKRMRQRLRSPAGRKLYERRKGLIEPVFGTLKEHRGNAEVLSSRLGGCKCGVPADGLSLQLDSPSFAAVSLAARAAVPRAAEPNGNGTISTQSDGLERVATQTLQSCRNAAINAASAAEVSILAFLTQTL